MEARFHTVSNLVRPPPFVMNYAPTGPPWAVAKVNSGTNRCRRPGAEVCRKQKVVFVQLSGLAKGGVASELGYALLFMVTQALNVADKLAGKAMGGDVYC